jgi:Family of unknown function (DUF5678)
MLQDNRDISRRLHSHKSLSSQMQWGIANNNPRSSLQRNLGRIPNAPAVTKTGVSSDRESALADLMPDPILPTMGLADPVVSAQHSRPSVQTLLQEASMLSQPDQFELITLLIQKMDAPTPAQAESRPTSIKQTVSRDREMQWLAENRNKYVGQWVVVEGDRLIASGSNSREVFQAAKQAGIEVPFLVQVEPEDQLPFGGW